MAPSILICVPPGRVLPTESVASIISPGTQPSHGRNIHLGLVILAYRNAFNELYFNIIPAVLLNKMVKPPHRTLRCVLLGNIRDVV